MRVVSFDEAWASVRDRRHYLLLGNGFSIALKPDIFTYRSLFGNADFSAAPKVPLLFEALGTTDFEVVIKHLLDSARILEVYRPGRSAFPDRLRADAATIKSVLVDAIAKGHPDRPYDITPEQYAACRSFLDRFGHIYTLNYDVLLYWTMMQSEVDCLDLRGDDGFRHPENADEPYVSWQEANSPTVHYLHGALHLFDAGSEIIKYTWSKTDVPIVEQIRQALDEERYPLFVAEGDSASKQEKILHNAYLHKAFRSFQSICDQGNGALVIFGHSLASNDLHILREIAKGKIPEVLISVFGDASSSNNQQLERNARKLVADRNAYRPRNPLKVTFFNAQSANVWTGSARAA